MIYLREARLREPVPDYSWLKELPMVRQMERDGGIRFDAPMTVFVGENGSGKSTLLEALAVGMGFNPEGGSREHSFSTMDSHSELHAYFTMVKGGFPKDGFFLRAESFYNVASYLEESGSEMKRYGGVPLHRRSHGEAFLALVENRFVGHGLYLLDEPEAALSPQRLLTLLVLLDRLVKAGSQFIIATHSPILMAYPGADIRVFDENGLRRAAYRDTEHYKVTKQFMDNPERMMRYLLDDDDDERPRV